MEEAIPYIFVGAVLLFLLAYYWAVKTDPLREPMRKLSNYPDDFDPSDASIHPSAMALVGYPFKRHLSFRTPQISFGFSEDSLLVNLEKGSSLHKQIYHVTRYRIPYSEISLEDFDHYQIIRIGGDIGIGLVKGEENVLPELRDRLASQ